MTLAVQVIAILFMLTMMFLGIWSFVIANKAYRQIKYKNYLLEKIAHNISLIRKKDKIFDNLTDIDDDSVSYSDIKDNLLDDFVEPLDEDLFEEIQDEDIFENIQAEDSPKTYKK